MPDSRRKPPAVNSRRDEIDVSHRDPAAEIASRQHGVVARWQLRKAGLTDRAIEYRVASGRLHRVHRGVYLVGHRLFLPRGREAAALLACGPGSVLSHMSAAAFWALVAEPPASVDVTIVGRDRRRHAGIRVHRTSDLPRREIRIRDGLPVTAPARTLLDLAAVIRTRDLRWAFNEAQVQRLVREADLLSLLARFPRRRGTKALRALIDEAREPALTESEGERRMLELIEKGRLPTPRVNFHLAGHRVDLYWPDHALVVEVDGYAFHSRPADFERDHRREQDLAAAGVRVSRVTWHQIVDEPEAVIARLAQALVVRGTDV